MIDVVTKIIKDKLFNKLIFYNDKIIDVVTKITLVLKKLNLYHWYQEARAKERWRECRQFGRSAELSAEPAHLQQLPPAQQPNWTSWRQIPPNCDHD